MSFSQEGPLSQNFVNNISCNFYCKRGCQCHETTMFAKKNYKKLNTITMFCACSAVTCNETYTKVFVCTSL